MYYLTRVGLFSSWIKTEKRIKQPTPKKQQPTIYIYIYIYLAAIYLSVLTQWRLCSSSAPLIVGCDGKNHPTPEVIHRPAAGDI
mmetsp:Transcript_1927/g.2886  ORF Transcript_1927/g.2886 Transcript_1927/m.2886 type:complete len:84 (-) Transcript_1927:75-326(-)